MIPSFFTYLALGTITTMVASIMALSSWISGSQIIQGNVFYDTTSNANPGIYVNTKQVLSMTGGGLSFTTNGTQSGVSLLDGATRQFAIKSFDCTGTGGNVKVSGGAKYDTCIVPPQLSTTGAIRAIDLMISASPVAVGIDCGFVKGRVSGTGTSFQNLGNFTSATGSLVTFSTGSLRWNSADFIKCGTLGTPTASFAGKIRVHYFDDTSE